MQALKKNIVLTGGGTSGHVTPNLALIKKLKQADWEITYIGSNNGVEKNLISKTNTKYYGIFTGKLRRYFSWQNFIDPFKIIFGVFQSLVFLRKIKPQLVFSKGGFVSFPVVFAAWLQKIPVVIHESDFTPGLANKLSFPFAKKICLTFKETAKYFKNKNKLVVTGTPIREEFFRGDASLGKKICGFLSDKPMLLFLGGGQGSRRINNIVQQTLDELLNKYCVAHICGANKLEPNLQKKGEYIQFTYLHDELFHIMAAAEIVISRAGANSLSELLLLKKLNILIPLPTSASRGDQIINADFAKNNGLSEVIADETLSSEKLVQTINLINDNKDRYLTALNKFAYPNGTMKIIEIFETLI